MGQGIAKNSRGETSHPSPLLPTLLFTHWNYLWYNTSWNHIDPKSIINISRAYYFSAMQRKIYRLLVTDFCCWVPITIMAFINFSGVHLSGIAYVVSAILLLPINSALNPILYSDVFDKFVDAIRNRILPKFRSQKSFEHGTQLTQISHAENTTSSKGKAG